MWAIIGLGSTVGLVLALLGTIFFVLDKDKIWRKCAIFAGIFLTLIIMAFVSSRPVTVPSQPGAVSAADTTLPATQ
ncbi:MAG: hypothetical protein PHC60_01510 [Heliobacteriaceae bacterium]|nr:hypothetical protein [Heliobacteriaceae bacterium]MDD4587053.1 hypothetical protein [Heliobacteriaceae bacterium]